MSANRTAPSAHSSRLRNVVIFLSLLGLVILLQLISGTYQGEFAGYPDEPAHYVTSVMVRDFILGGNFSHPMQFATDYYNRYPKVAFGHWPPLLYIVQGAWMLLFSVSRASVLVELACTTALASFLLFLVAARHFGTWAGLLAAATLVCLPVIQTSSNEEMAESLLLVTGFAAALFFYRYLEQKRWQDSLWFGICCSLAILTKGNGWALAMVPPIAILATRDFAVLLKPSFWIPVPIVAVLCLPWQVMTLEMARRGWSGGESPSVQYTLDALVQFAAILHNLVGWAIFALALCGIWFRIVLPFRERKVQPLDAVMLGLLICIWVFHSVVPAGVEERKMIDALPALLLFALAGGSEIARRLSSLSGVSVRFKPWLPLAVGCATMMLFLAETFTVPSELHYGFTEASRFIETNSDMAQAAILVSSERDGEGLLISELLMQDGTPRHTILRANKLLSVSDWNGHVAQEFCENPRDVMTVIKAKNVRTVVLDTYPRRVHYRHNELIREAIKTYPGAWQLAATFGNGKIEIYRVKA